MKMNSDFKQYGTMAELRQSMGLDVSAFNLDQQFLLDHTLNILRNHFPSVYHMKSNPWLNDSDGGFNFLRSLEYIKRQTYDIKYADLKFRNIFPVSNEADPGAEFITYTSYDKRGTAKFIANYADDLPRADVSGRQQRNNVRTIGGSYGYNVMEMKAAAMTGGKSLDAARAEAADRMIEQLLNTTAFFGATDFGIDGFFSNTLIPRGAVAAGASTSTDWTTKTPQEIINDIGALFTSIDTNTLMVESANILLLPPAKYDFIANTWMGTPSNETVLSFILRTNPYLTNGGRIEKLNELTDAVLACNAAVPGGITGNDTDYLMVAYSKDPKTLQFEIPLEKMALPVQTKNLEFEVPMLARTGGLTVYYPLAIAFGGGI